MWKRRNCSLRAISSFPSAFSTDILQTHKNQGLFGKGLKGMVDVFGSMVMSEYGSLTNVTSQSLFYHRGFLCFVFNPLPHMPSLGSSNSTANKI